MAVYKVPQDVEADDKLLGPFSFRQFIYLVIVFVFIAIAYLLARIFLMLAFIPLPFIIFFSILALPLKKEQPMETYLAAVISFHLKPNKRFWMPGQRDKTITISAPKIIEAPRTRDISGQEASHRLSFLANIVDSAGFAIHDSASTPVKQQFLAEAQTIPDVMDISASPLINQMLMREENTKHDEIVAQMRTALAQSEASASSVPSISLHNSLNTTPTSTPLTQESSPASPNPTPNPDLVQLAHNSDFSIQTIQNQANRLTADSEERIISLR